MKLPPLNVNLTQEMLKPDGIKESAMDGMQPLVSPTAANMNASQQEIPIKERLFQPLLAGKSSGLYDFETIHGISKTASVSPQKLSPKYGAEYNSLTSLPTGATTGITASLGGAKHRRIHTNTIASLKQQAD